MARFTRLASIFAVCIVLVNCPSTPKPPANTVAAPAFSPAEGVYADAQSVTLSTSTEGAQIRYTTDGSSPSAASGTVYSGPIKVSSTTTIRAIATKTGLQDSPVVSATFTIKAGVTTTDGQHPTVAPVTDEEITAARNALARAKEADADYFDRDNYDAARQLLDEGISLRTSDPAAARQKLADSTEKANLSFDNSIEKSAAVIAANLEAARKRLLALEADKFASDDYQKSTAGIDEAAALFEEKDYSGSRARSYQALKEMTDLANRLETQLATVKSLKYETEQLMKEAESEGLYAYAPSQKDKVTSLYLKGVDSFQGYRLDDAEENFGAAREAARDTIRIAREARDGSQAEQKQKAEAMQQQVMKALVEASSLTVVTDDGTVVKPKNWKDEDFLKEIDRMMQEEQDKPSSGPQSMAVPADQATVVMADDTTVNLLQQARDLWVQGLKEKQAGNYGKALDYFNEAQRYIDIYKSFAVKGVYTVRLIPDRRDCLWRIAEYSDIYGDPYKWPNIWRRNRKLIQNPDLIFPGWQLVIPAQ
jgi:nucleoid-associated protein YgaU